MRPDRFEKLVHEQLEICLNTLAAKGVEYATVEDKLHNFVVAAALENTTLAAACSGMMVKHTVSIYDMIPDALNWSPAIWDEKITDHINYLLLLKACLIQMQDQLPSEATPGSIRVPTREAYTHNA